MLTQLEQLFMQRLSRELKERRIPEGDLKAALQNPATATAMAKMICDLGRDITGSPLPWLGAATELTQLEQLFMQRLSWKLKKRRIPERDLKAALQNPATATVAAKMICDLGRDITGSPLPWLGAATEHELKEARLSGLFPSPGPNREKARRTRLLRTLQNAGVRTVFDLTSYSREELAAIRYVSDKSIEIIERALEARGLSLKKSKQ